MRPLPYSLTHLIARLPTCLPTHLQTLPTCRLLACLLTELQACSPACSIVHVHVHCLLTSLQVCLRLLWTSITAARSSSTVVQLVCPERLYFFSLPTLLTLAAPDYTHFAHPLDPRICSLLPFLPGRLLPSTPPPFHTLPRPAFCSLSKPSSAPLPCDTFSSVKYATVLSSSCCSATRRDQREARNHLKFPCHATWAATGLALQPCIHFSIHLCLLLGSAFHAPTE